MTHDMCVGLAGTWLRNKSASHIPYRSKVILLEMVGYQSMMYGCELPDVLGVWNNNIVINIECKVSRSDFLADKNKLHNHPIGNYKFFACPYGLISPDEIPKEFGLLYLNGRGGKLIKEPIRVDSDYDITAMLADLIINGVDAGVLNSSHKKRPKRMWDGKAVIL